MNDFYRVIVLKLSLTNIKNLKCAGILLPFLTWGQGPLILGKIVHKSIKLGQSSRKRLIRRIFTPTFHVVRLKNPSGDSSVRLFFQSACV